MKKWEHAKGSMLPFLDLGALGCGRPEILLYHRHRFLSSKKLEKKIFLFFPKTIDKPIKKWYYVCTKRKEKTQ